MDSDKRHMQSGEENRLVFFRTGYRLKMRRKALMTEAEA